MKQLQIGETEYQVAQFKDDINYKRFIMFKQYAPMIWERMDSPMFQTYLDRVDTYYNEGKFMKARMELENYLAAIRNVENGHDAWSICFALITLAPGEDPLQMQEAVLQKKIDKMCADGLDAGTVYESVTDFMKAFRETFSAHLEVLAILGAGNILKPSAESGS